MNSNCDQPSLIPRSQPQPTNLVSGLWGPGKFQRWNQIWCAALGREWGSLGFGEFQSFGRMLRISRRAGSILLVLLAMSKVWNDLEPMKRPCRSCILYIVHTIDALTLTWIYHFQRLRWHWPVPSRNPKAPHVAFGSVEVSKQDWTLTELRFVLDFVIVVSQMLSDCDSVRCFSMFEHKKPHEVVTLVLRCKWPNWTREVLPLAEAVSKYSVQILRVRCVRF
jgi:hypothetical protein